MVRQLHGFTEWDLFGGERMSPCRQWWWTIKKLIELSLFLDLKGSKSGSPPLWFRGNRFKPLATRGSKSVPMPLLAPMWKSPKTTIRTEDSWQKTAQNNSQLSNASGLMLEVHLPYLHHWFKTTLTDVSSRPSTSSLWKRYRLLSQRYSTLTKYAGSNSETEKWGY
jgi:hypothetical protein